MICEVPNANDVWLFSVVVPIVINIYFTPHELAIQLWLEDENKASPENNLACLVPVQTRILIPEQ